MYNKYIYKRIFKGFGEDISPADSSINDANSDANSNINDTAYGITNKKRYHYPYLVKKYPFLEDEKFLLGTIVKIITKHPELITGTTRPQWTRVIRHTSFNIKCIKICLKHKNLRHSFFRARPPITLLVLWEHYGFINKVKVSHEPRVLYIPTDPVKKILAHYGITDSNLIKNKIGGVKNE